MQLLPTIHPLTMSSREIADMTGRRHDNVMPICRQLRDTGVCPEIQETPYTNHQNGQTYAECQLSKRDSLVLIARLSPEFTAALVDRWQQLEAQQTPAVPQTMAQALRLAAEQAEQLEAQHEQLALAAPKVEFVDRYVQAGGAKGFREVAKLLQAKEPEFRSFLAERRVMYRLGEEWTAYQPHIDAGRFVVRAGVARGNEHAFSTTKFTPKGVQWIAAEWAKRSQVQKAGSTA